MIREFLRDPDHVAEQEVTRGVLVARYAAVAAVAIGSFLINDGVHHTEKLLGKQTQEVVHTTVNKPTTWQPK